MREGRTSGAFGRMVNASEFEAGVDETGYYYLTAWLHCVGGDYETALETNAQALKLALGGQRASLLWLQAFNMIMLGRIEEARPFIEEGWKLDRSKLPKRYIFLFARIGEKQRARKILTDSRFALKDNNYLAMGHLALGDIDNALKFVRAGIENHNQFLIGSLLVGEWWESISRRSSL